MWKAFSHTWTAGTTLSGLRHRRMTNLQKDKNSDNRAKQRLFPCNDPCSYKRYLHRSIIHTYPTQTQHPRDRASSPHEAWQSHRRLSNRDQENLINKKKRRLWNCLSFAISISATKKYSLWKRQRSFTAICLE